MTVDLTSPALYRLSRGYSWAMMITASHESDDETTGIKVAQDGLPWTPDLYDVAQTGAFLTPPREPVPGLQPSAELYAYRRMLTGVFGGLYIATRPLHIWAGSVVVGVLAQDVFRDFGFEVTMDVVDGLDPASEQSCQPLLGGVEGNAVLLDADGDRMGMIWNGGWFPPEMVTQVDLAALANSVEAGRTGVLMDIRTDAATLGMARALGFIVELGPGGRWFNLACASPKFAYGAEPSGHRYWQSWGGSDCAIYGAIKTALAFINADPDPNFPESPPVMERRGLPGVPVMEGFGDWDHVDLGPEGSRWDGPHGWICVRRASDGLYAMNWQGDDELEGFLPPEVK